MSPKNFKENYVFLVYFNPLWKFILINMILTISSNSIFRLVATPGTAAYQAPPSMGFSRQEYWSGVPLPSPFLPYSVQFSRSVVSDSVWPHRQQPTRLLCPWDSPGKNTGVGCHFLLQCMKVKSENEVAQSSPTLSDTKDCKPTRLLRPWDFPGKSTGVGCHCLLCCLTTKKNKKNI